MQPVISNVTFNFSSLENLPIFEKFSHTTLQNFSTCNAEKTLITKALEPSSYDGSVTLIRNNNEVCHTLEKIPSDSTYISFLHDCDTLSKTELRMRYSREATAHKNMLSRAKSKKAIIHQGFREFKSFLKYVGPMPAKGATLDRINNEDPEYAPDKVRWADKHTQNNNKGDTATFYSTHKGETFTASRAAKLQGVTPAAIRQRRNRGWSDDEIIHGKLTRGGTVAPELKGTSPLVVPNGQASPVRPMTIREHLFKERAESYAYARAKHGGEAFLPTFDQIHELFAEIGEEFTEAQYEAKIKRLWPAHRPHVNFFNLLPVHQRLIEKIDPEYVKAVREKQRLIETVKECC